MNKIKLFALVATMLVLAGCGETGPKAPGKYADVARCLTQKGVIMYGAYWCPHCANQKSFFSDDFQFIHYQECDDKGPNGSHLACVKAGVTSFPTWFFPGQGNLVGEQQVWDLAKVGNCDDKLPKEDQDKLAAQLKAADAAKTPATPATATTAPATTTTAPTSSSPVTTTTPAVTTIPAVTAPSTTK